MWLRGCGWLKYDEPAPLPANNGTLRTWAFAKADTGFKVYAEEKLLLEYTYAEGLWNKFNVLLLYKCNIMYFIYFFSKF